MFDYFHANEQEQYLFLQLPLMLIKDETFKVLSDGAKILYSLLLNRTSLSSKNGWQDEQGRVYIIYTIEEIMSDLNCWEKKATKSMKELKDIGLVKSIRQGLGKPNILYVMNFSTVLKFQPKNSLEPTKPVNTQTCQKNNSGIAQMTIQEPAQSTIQELSKGQCSYIDFNKIYSSEIESESRSTSDSIPIAEKTDMTLTMTTDAPTKNILEIKKGLTQTLTVQSTGTQSPITTSDNKYTVYRDIIQENIEYQYFALNRPTDIEMLDELVNCMLDVILTDGDTIKINGEQKSRALVKSQYLKLNSQDVEHILSKFREQRHKITHVHNYLKTMLYVVKQEVNAGVENAVRVDGLVW